MIMSFFFEAFNDWSYVTLYVHQVLGFQKNFYTRRPYNIKLHLSCSFSVVCEIRMWSSNTNTIYLYSLY